MLYDVSNGVLQPFAQLGWWKWMYRVTPFTYLIEGMLGQGVFYPSPSAGVIITYHLLHNY